VSSSAIAATALSARMDPEDLREVISAYQKCIGETVRRFGGFVAKNMGDGVLVYFGYPQEHKDDAERAVRAGLELIAVDRAAALYDPAAHRPLAVRFGQGNRVAVLSYRSLALWLLGHPEAALEDSHRALSDAREISQASTLMYARFHSSTTHI
jgi:hypothetical protein